MNSIWFISAFAAIGLARCLGASSPPLVTSPARISSSASGDSLLPVVNSDGRFLFFLSSARNLGLNDGFGRSLHLFRKDLQDGTVLLVSVNASGSSVSEDCRGISVSSNGLLAAFSTAADGLVTGDTNKGEDIFLRNLTNDAVLLVSVDRQGNSPSDPLAGKNLPLSANPHISADGQLVAFQSRATNLVAQADLNADTDVFARDLQRNGTVLVSVATEADRAGNGWSELEAITPDGRFVLFRSCATNLVNAQLPTGGEALFLRDLRDEVTLWISSDAATFLPDGTNAIRCVQR